MLSIGQCSFLPDSEWFTAVFDSLEEAMEGQVLRLASPRRADSSFSVLDTLISQARRQEEIITQMAAAVELDDVHRVFALAVRLTGSSPSVNKCNR